jgi:hypothetical protein
MRYYVLQPAKTLVTPRMVAPEVVVAPGAVMLEIPAVDVCGL